MRQSSFCVVAIAVWIVGEVLAQNAPLAPPDFAGVTAENFWDGGRYSPANPHGDYTIPAIDPTKAIIVDPEGVGAAPSDENPGTVQKPFRTIARAVQELTPGTVILLRKGRYIVDGIKIANVKGTAQNPVVISSFPNETVVITSAVAIKDWKSLGDNKVWVHELGEADKNNYGPIFIDGRLLSSIRRHLFMTASDKALLEMVKDKSEKPLPETFITQGGTWAKDGSKVYVRAPGDADPNTLGIEACKLAPGAQASIWLENCSWVIFNRLIFANNSGALISRGGGNNVIRYCIFGDNLGCMTFSGGNNAQRNIIDHCMFERSGDAAAGNNIYATAPFTIRYCLIKDSSPGIPGITAYTSKYDAVSGLDIIGNTFVHGSACITSTFKDAVIRDNIALGSRFLSSAGSNAVIENNIAVYDARDREMYPNVPRRDIGFRMYGKNTIFRNNTLIGFGDAGNVYPPPGAVEEKKPDADLAVLIEGNKFYRFTERGIRFYTSLAGVKLKDNLYVPTTGEIPIIELKLTGAVMESLTLAQWQERSYDQGSKVEAEARLPNLPAVLKEVMPKSKN